MSFSQTREELSGIVSVCVREREEKRKKYRTEAQGILIVMKVG